jgi:hypothetical protein
MRHAPRDLLTETFIELPKHAAGARVASLHFVFALLMSFAPSACAVASLLHLLFSKGKLSLALSGFRCLLAQSSSKRKLLA